jgi:hypothetical protein
MSTSFGASYINSTPKEIQTFYEQNVCNHYILNGKFGFYFRVDFGNCEAISHPAKGRGF